MWIRAKIIQTILKLISSDKCTATYKLLYGLSKDNIFHGYIQNNRNHSEHMNDSLYMVFCERKLLVDLNSINPWNYSMLLSKELFQGYMLN